MICISLFQLKCVDLYWMHFGYLICVGNYYTYMNYQSPKHKIDRGNEVMNRCGEIRRRSAFDRHIRKLDTDRLNIKDTSPSNSSKSSSSYQSQLEESLFKRKGIRQYTIQKRQKKERNQVVARKVVRSAIPIRRFKVSGWIDNYYSSLLDWSYNNFICAANNQHLYFYNMAMDDQLENALYRQYTLRNCHQKINSIHFSPTHTKIAVGYNEGSFIFYDYFKQKSCNPLRQHNLRISIIQWQNNLIYTGSKDRKIKCLDSRTLKKSISLPNVHTQQVCGLKAHCNYLASGGNDNNVYIYDIRKSERHLDNYRHDAAVKALDWIIPNVLISGGGTIDRKINYWKDSEGIIKTIDTGSQVCGLIASINSDEVVSCQGFSLNQIIIWDIHGNRSLTVHGHQSRVLYSALSPGGRFVATGAGDQMLHIWNFFESSKQEWPSTDMR